MGTLLVCGALAMGSASCAGDDDDDPKQCTKVQAAFDLSVRAVSGPLPADTMITVGYAGGEETYRLDTAQQLEVVLCNKVAPDGGDAGGKEVTAVHCKLWTQSAATVTVTSNAYPTVERDLTAVKKNGCFETQAIEIVLGDQDASS